MLAWLRQTIIICMLVHLFFTACSFLTDNMKGLHFKCWNVMADKCGATDTSL